MKQRHLRVGDELRDEDAVVVRGGELNGGILREDALRNHAIYGTYGIPVFAIRDLTLDELAQQPPLVRFERLSMSRWTYFVLPASVSSPRAEPEAFGRADHRRR